MTDRYGEDIDKLTKKISKLVVQVECQEGIKAGQCEYTALGQRCTFPGTMSAEIHGPGKWYCRFHYQQLHQGLTEAEAAAKVRECVTSGQQSHWLEVALRARTTELREKGDPMMVIADKLAAGHGDREDKAEFLQLFRQKLRGIGVGGDDASKGRRTTEVARCLGT